jgi:hypothetical protein
MSEHLTKMYSGKMEQLLESIDADFAAKTISVKEINKEVLIEFDSDDDFLVLD